MTKTNSEPFYMVVVEEGLAQKTKYLKYEDAFKQCLSISKKENKKAYVVVSITEVETHIIRSLLSCCHNFTTLDCLILGEIAKNRIENT
jgi:hypothetical protein